MDALLQDLRYAIRTLRTSPGFLLAAVLTMALCIGANTAIFSLVDAVVLRRLPVRAPDRLVLLTTDAARASRTQFSYATLRQLRQHHDVVQSLLGYTSCCGRSILSRDGDNQVVERQFVTGDFFSTLGVAAFRGRLFSIDDDEPSAPAGAVVVVSYRMWRQRLSASDGIVGSTLILDGTPVTVVGIAPSSFRGVEIGRDVDVYVPQYLAPKLTSSPFSEDTPWLTAIARLKAGVSVAEATAALRAVQPQVRAGSKPKERALPTFLRDPFALEPAATGASALRDRLERPLIVLLATVGLVLLIGSANVANLLLARNTARRGELGIRVALGASRGRLIQHLLCESAILSLCGAVLGALFASWIARALVVQFSTARAPIALDLPVDGRVLAFIASITALTALVFGVLPSGQATAIAPNEALQAHGRGTFGERQSPWSSGLLIVQVVLSLVLVVGTGLFVRTLTHLSAVTLGFDPEHVVIATVSASTISAEERPRFFDRLVRQIATVPGVMAVGGGVNPPLEGSLAGDFVVGAPGTIPPPDAPPIPQFESITPGWFAAYDIRVLVGRVFNDGDTRESPQVMIVNERFARQYLSGREAVGTPLALTIRHSGADYPFGTRAIVGVVSDSVYHSIRDAVQPMIYVPLAQRADALPQKELYIGIRASTRSPELLEHAVSLATNRFDPNLAVTFRRLTQQVDDSLSQERVMAGLSLLFGGLAVLLSALGLYGVTAYDVVRRRKEIGIRMALGATPSRVLGALVTRVLRLVTIGAGVGTILALWLSRFVRSLLYGVGAFDAFTVGSAVGLLIFVALVSTWLPARRAVGVDPMVALRTD
jgi:predicted permease